jgi:hypothetical protein
VPVHSAHRLGQRLEHPSPAFAPIVTTHSRRPRIPPPARLTSSNHRLAGNEAYRLSHFPYGLPSSVRLALQDRPCLCCLSVYPLTRPSIRSTPPNPSRQSPSAYCTQAEGSSVKGNRPHTLTTLLAHHCPAHCQRSAFAILAPFSSSIPTSVFRSFVPVTASYAAASYVVVRIVRLLAPVRHSAKWLGRSSPTCPPACLPAVATTVGRCPSGRLSRYRTDGRTGGGDCMDAKCILKHRQDYSGT